MQCKDLRVGARSRFLSTMSQLDVISFAFDDVHYRDKSQLISACKIHVIICVPMFPIPKYMLPPGCYRLNQHILYV